MYVIDFTKLKISCEDYTLHELCLPDGLKNDDLKMFDSIVARSQPLHKGDVLFRPG